MCAIVVSYELKTGKLVLISCFCHNLTKFLFFYDILHYACRWAKFAVRKFWLRKRTTFWKVCLYCTTLQYIHTSLQLLVLYYCTVYTVISPGTFTALLYSTYSSLSSYFYCITLQYIQSSLQLLLMYYCTVHTVLSPGTYTVLLLITHSPLSSYLYCTRVQ